MKSKFLIFALLFWSFVGYSQNKEEAEKLVEEGTAYHDKGDYEGAIKRYDKALLKDKDNLVALYEKSYTLLHMKKYDEVIACCKTAIEAHPGDDMLKNIYVTYGTAYDDMNKTDQSEEIYNEGIKAFPDYYLLHFNKGITLASVKKYDDAMQCFFTSAKLNPRHAGSNNAIARLQYDANKRIPALLAYCRFMVLEPESDRAKENLEALQELLGANVVRNGKKNITINVSADMFADTTEDGKNKENNFSTQDMILSLTSALDFDKKNKDETEVQRFARKFKMLCSSLKETSNKNSGFFWDYYAPYFIEMNEKDLIDTFAYIVYASSDDASVVKWLKSHKKELDEFYDWSAEFSWNTK